MVGCREEVGIIAVCPPYTCMPYPELLVPGNFIRDADKPALNAFVLVH